MNTEGLRLMYSRVNQAFVYVYGNAPFRMEGEDLFFRNRKDAISAAERKDLKVDSKGYVHSRTDEEDRGDYLARRRGGFDGVSEDDNEKFFDSYVQTALWSTNDYSTPEGGEPLDKNYGPEDLTPEAEKTMRADAKKFLQENRADIGDRVDYAGHDFWLTRNGHGAGFWDGDWPEPAATRLTKAAEKFGEQWIYVGDDGKLHVS